MSVTQPVPQEEAFLVEYPGYVQNPDAVIHTLGGIDSLSAASHGDSSLLQLKFRPDDPLAHPVYGERQPTRGLLVKLSRNSSDTSRIGVKAEVIASVHSKFTFTGMADYQYQSAVPSTSGLGPVDGPYGEETEPLLCIPPVFTKADVPLDYAFKNFRASDRPGNMPLASGIKVVFASGAEAKPCKLTVSHAVASSKTKQPPWLIPFSAQHVPQLQLQGRHL